MDRDYREAQRRENQRLRNGLDRIHMQDEGDLHASFDSLSGYQKVLTLIGLTIVAWTVLGVLAWVAYKLVNPNA